MPVERPGRAGAAAWAGARGSIPFVGIVALRRCVDAPPKVPAHSAGSTPCRCQGSCPEHHLDRGRSPHGPRAGWTRCRSAVLEPTSSSSSADGTCPRCTALARDAPPLGAAGWSRREPEPCCIGCKCELGPRPGSRRTGRFLSSDATTRPPRPVPSQSFASGETPRAPGRLEQADTCIGCKDTHRVCTDCNVGPVEGA